MEDLQGGTLALEHRYDLEKRSGDFALFTMYRGVQHPFERPVWIKVCEAPAEFSTPDVYDRLRRSVVEAAEIRHPLVCTIVDFGDIDQHVPFVVVDRPEGITLDAYLDQHGTLPPDEALALVRRVAEIVQDIHEQGIVHGGIAPRWITVDREANIFVDHFGLQPTMAEIRTMDGAILSADLLWSLPPEQFDDEPVEPDAAADVWALGALLYWLLSGVHPFFDDPKDTGDGILRLRSGSRPPSLSDLGVEPSIAEVVDRAMAPDRSDRYGTVAQLLDALPDPEAAAAEEETQVADRVPSPSVEPTVEPGGGTGQGTALAVTLVLLVLSNLGWAFWMTSSEPQTEPTVKSLPAQQPQVLPSGVQLLSEPEGARLFITDGNKETEFGDLPMVVDPKSDPDGELPLIVRKHGFDDVRIDVKETADGQDWVIHLREPAEDSDE
jgi:serine/threonine protein kinase